MTDAFFLPHPVNPVHPVEKSSERIKGGPNKRRLSIADEKLKIMGVPYLVRALLPRERLDILLILSKHHPSCFRDCPFLSPWNFTISGSPQFCLVAASQSFR